MSPGRSSTVCARRVGDDDGDCEIGENQLIDDLYFVVNKFTFENVDFRLTADRVARRQFGSDVCDNTADAFTHRPEVYWHMWCVGYQSPRSVKKRAGKVESFANIY